VQNGDVKAGQMVDSIHLGHHPYYWGGGGTGLARALFNTPALKPLKIGAANTETNAKQRAQNRAMMEAGDLNDWLNAVDIADRLHMHGARFWTEIYTQGVPMSFTPLLRLKHCRACDRWYSSRAYWGAL
jgi:hypothetical protein